MTGAVAVTVPVTSKVICAQIFADLHIYLCICFRCTEEYTGVRCEKPDISIFDY